MAVPTPPIRHAGRVLLIDGDDRVLLFRSHVSPRHGHAFWFPVGGAVEAGEDFETAVAREVLEETGVRGVVLGPEVFRRQFIFHWRDRVWDARERWWLSRVAHFEPDFSGMDSIEIDDFTDCRWLSLADLAAVREAGDALVPANLLELLPALLAGRYPAVPIEVGE